MLTGAATCLFVFAVMLGDTSPPSCLHKKNTSCLMLRTVAGLFVFAVMLGVVTDEIKQTFKSIRSGKFPLNQVWASSSSGVCLIYNHTINASELCVHLLSLF